MHHDAYDIVAIGCSAGGLRALKQILGRLDASFPAPILVAQHRGYTPNAHLVTMLTSWTGLAVKQAEEGEQPRRGTVYLAPAGRHLELSLDARLSVERRGRVNFVCPSADLLFRSVAACHGSRALVVVLTGQGRDGADGVAAVRAAGGFVLVQDPDSCEYAGMPATAIETRQVDLVLPLQSLSYALNRLAVPG
jgi:two-component system chemotaxis response regulator CheB